MHIVLINGWSANASLWDDFISLFHWETQFEVIDLDKPLSHGEWMREIDSRVQDGSVLMGWSLGGELAISYAASTTKALKSLCLFQTNPCFVEKQDWPFGVSAELFGQFQQLVDSKDEQRIKRQFAHMMVEGSEDHKADRRLLRRLYESSSSSMAALQSGMDLLSGIDVWDELNNLELPVLNILGEQDALVSVDFSQHYPSSVVKGMGHVPCLAHKEAVYGLVWEFLNTHV